MLDMVTRLKLFFDQQDAITRRPMASGLTRLAAFFEQSRPLLRHLSSKPHGPKTSAIDTLKFGETLTALRQPLANARTQGSLLNVWKMAGLKRNEVRTAAVLASLWDAGVCPQTAAPFLHAFLARLPGGGSFPTYTELEAGYVVRTEDCPLGNAGSRVDLSIEGRDFLLLIEVKIDAGEGLDQVARYDRLLRAKADLLGKRPSLVFLGPRRPVTGTAIHASWLDVSAAARVVIQGRKRAERTFVDHLLEHFASHVAAFV